MGESPVLVPWGQTYTQQRQQCDPSGAVIKVAAGISRLVEKKPKRIMLLWEPINCSRKNQAVAIPPFPTSDYMESSLVWLLILLSGR